ncbi:MAG: TolC family protein [Chitinophaga sp.]|jgi:outer membrane protein|nr:TolC family protein [Chitinophaga sp.]
MNKHKLHFMLLLMLTAPAWLMAQSTTKHAFTVLQAVEFAKQNNASVKNALLGIRIQEQTNRGITAAAFPSLAGNIALNDYFDVPTQLFPASFAGGPAGTYYPVKFGLKYNSTASLQLQQLLFDGQVFIGLQARRTSMDFAKQNVAVTEEGIKVNVYKIYYQLVVSKTQIDLLDANIARLEKLKHDATELYKNGFAEKLDVDKVDVQLSNLQTEKQKALNSIEIGYTGLKTLIGMPIKDTLILTDNITENDIKTGALNDTVNYNDRSDYKYLQFAKKLNEYNIKRYQYSFLPTLSANLLYGQQAYRDKFTFFKSGDWYPISYVGLNLSVPIFSGFGKEAKVKQSRFELQQTINNIDNLKLSIDNDVKQAQLNFNSAIQTMDFQKKNMQLAENVYNQTKKKYEVGTGSNTEINAAQTDLITAQTNYINALYSAVIAKIDYLKATGKLQ